jgi:hypothetical protein
MPEPSDTILEYRDVPGAPGCKGFQIIGRSRRSVMSHAAILHIRAAALGHSCVYHSSTYHDDAGDGFIVRGYVSDWRPDHDGR